MKKILIIDDEEKLRGLLARILKAENFDILEAGDLKSGLKKVEQNAIDVVLCDVKLPDGSGVVFVPQLKKADPLIEVILLTTSAAAVLSCCVSIAKQNSKGSPICHGALLFTNSHRKPK